MLKIARLVTLVFIAALVFAAFPGASVTAQDDMMDGCSYLPTHGELREVLQSVVAEENGGFGFHMWITVVDRDGTVCAVIFSGNQRGDQWPGSRVISAQKANTANAFSLPGFALSTGNLFTAVQPGNSLFGLQESNPVDTAVAYGGDATAFGQENDPMVGHRIGGVNVFGGGLALYAGDGSLVGALGVSGDTSCTDHVIAWKVRDAIGYDYVPAGVSETGDDNLIFDPANGWAHPDCGMGETEIAAEFVETHPTGPVASSSSPMTLGDVASEVEGASSTVVRTDAGIRVDVHTNGLTDGHAYTVWAMVFNNPDSCSEGDCMSDMGNSDVATALFWATGAFVEDGDDAHLSGFVPADDTSIDMFPGMVEMMMGMEAPEAVGLVNPLGAEVHLILLDHGPAIAGIEEEQITTMMGGCREGENAFDPEMGPGFCPTAQVSAHMP